MPSLPKLRRATPADAALIGELLGQLGYPASGPDVAERLVTLEAFVDAVVFVADLDGGVAGVISGHLFPVLHQGPRAAYVTALVVGNAARRKGVGAMLVAAVEEWARQHGAAKISVTSALHRDDAHAFYEALGWARTGVRLGKELGRGQAD